ncbi:MAG: thioredoxin family protein, partial [Pseudomonadales bacterium]|nr:thioredoxin family protein [Pseudomonadales bacterium]
GARGHSEKNLTEMSVVLAILFAFLGGLILNLMPCVFPVLSIKILSLVDSVHSSGHSLRLHGWIYAAGVVASFVAIALILILLRLGGEAIGWGFQLQSPLVLALLAYLFFLIALNLLGIFEIGTSVMSLGGLGPSSGYLASFATGVLATVVAAPCTVPFMGAAVGFALTQSTMISLVIFGALGTGMAVPYLLLCYSPALQARLPAPGRWMQVLKEVMAFPMFASAIWLIWVLGLQTSPTGMMQVLAGVLLLGLAVWVLNNSRNAGMGRFIAALLIVGAVYPVIRLEVPEPDEMTISDSAVVSHQAQEFERYERQALTDAVHRGPVFVNFTAAWCITCKVNEVTVLSTVSVRQAMAANGVTYFRADWTSEDPVITAALAEYGRGGVPLYLLYRQGAERAEVLPQLLTKGTIIDALNRL